MSRSMEGKVNQAVYFPEWIP